MYPCAPVYVYNFSQTPQSFHKSLHIFVVVFFVACLEPWSTLLDTGKAVYGGTATFDPCPQTFRMHAGND